MQAESRGVLAFAERHLELGLPTMNVRGGSFRSKRMAQVHRRLFWLDSESALDQKVVAAGVA
jgi:hypothetical protein